MQLGADTNGVPERRSTDLTPHFSANAPLAAEAIPGSWGSAVFAQNLPFKICQAFPDNKKVYLIQLETSQKWIVLLETRANVGKAIGSTIPKFYHKWVV
jgi:hypothetical protein